MARTKSARFRQAAQQLSAAEAPVILIEISHALLAEPMRFVNDNQDLPSNGHNYRAAAFGFGWPDDQDKQTPRAQLSIANFGAGVGEFFERTHGGRGALIKVLQVMRSQPDFIEDELVLNLGDVQVSTQSVTAPLGYDDVLNRPGTPYTYRPEAAPGLF
jgi:hypothetical protein